MRRLKTHEIIMAACLLGVLLAALSGCTGYSHVKVFEWEAATGAAPDNYMRVNDQPFGWWEPKP
jgi:hypothetical protein